MRKNIKGDDIAVTNASAYLSEEIINVSERMFHDVGYKDTTFQKIADELGITKSTISYHFKNKHLLLLCIFDRYFAKLRDFIDQYPDEYENAYWRISVMYIYFYRVITSSKKNLDMFYRKDAMDEWEVSKVDLVSSHYQTILKDFHKTFTPLDLRMSVCMDLGARRRMYHEFVGNNADIQDIDTFCYYHVYLIGLLCRLDQATIDENLKKAFAFANAHVPEVPYFLQ